MRSILRGSILASAVIAIAGCADRSPTGPAAGETRGAAASIESSMARHQPRALAPRVSDEPGPIGTWGGQHMNLTIGAAGAVIEFDCAHGSIDEAFVTNAMGVFDLAGTYVQETPGPIGPNGPPPHPARYAGSTDGKTMSLTVTVTDTGQILGPFTLSLGAAGRVFKCV